MKAGKDITGFVFQKSFFEALKLMGTADEVRDSLFALCNLVYEEEEPEGLSGMPQMFITMVRPTVEASVNRYAQCVENGRKGGAPKGSRNNPNGRKGKGGTNQGTNQRTNQGTNLYKDKDKDKDILYPPLHDSPQIGGSVPQSLKIDFSDHSDTVKPGRKSKPFTPPTVEEVEAHLRAKGIDNVSAEAFVAFYESNGWKVGKNPMKNWKAAITTWKNRSNESPRQRNPDRGPDTAPTMNYFDFAK